MNLNIAESEKYWYSLKIPPSMCESGPAIGYFVFIEVLEHNSPSAGMASQTGQAQISTDFDLQSPYAHYLIHSITAFMLLTKYVDNVGWNTPLAEKWGGFGYPYFGGGKDALAAISP